MPPPADCSDHLLGRLQTPANVNIALGVTPLACAESQAYARIGRHPPYAVHWLVGRDLAGLKRHWDSQTALG